MKFQSLVLTGLSLLTLVSCGKMFMGDRTGQRVQFGISADMAEATKTAYSGEVINGRERINWVDRDPVRMIMLTHDQGVRSNVGIDTKTYYVVDIHEDGSKSSGKVAAAGGFLTWQENKEHDFYSIYPGNYIGSTDIGEDRSINLTLPSAQHGDIAANMRYAYMAAIHEGYQTSGKGSVVLDYYPMVTTVYITLNNATDAPVKVKSVRIKSTNGTPLVGTFTISSPGGTTPFSPTNDESATSPEVSVVLDDATLQPGSSTTCVIFLMPTRSYELNSLTMTVITEHGLSDISLANSASIDRFLPCKKYNLAFNIEEHPIEYGDLTRAMNNLCLLSNSALCTQFEYLDWMDPKGLYYKNSGWPPQPVTDKDLADALEQVTEISNVNDHSMDYMLADLTPADFSIFPNLQSINLSISNSNNSFSVADLNNLIELMYEGTATSLSIANCAFNQADPHPLVIKANAGQMESISLTNITGLEEIVLQGGSGQIGSIFIQNCPDVKTIKVLRGGGDIYMKKAVFDNLQSLETIYIERANYTTDLEANDCPSLVRFIVCNQDSWLVNNLSVTNCPELEDKAPDDSEYHLKGLSIEKVAGTFTASKFNCPKLGPTLTTLTNDGRPAFVVTYRE